MTKSMWVRITIIAVFTTYGTAFLGVIVPFIASFYITALIIFLWASCALSGWISSLVPRSNHTRFLKSKPLAYAIEVSLLLCAISTLVAINMPAKVELSQEEVLKSVPYLAWAPAKDTIEKKGVTIHDSSRSFPGVNLYVPRIDPPSAQLIDMSGKLLHEWRPKVADIKFWQNVKLNPDGTLLVIARDTMLMCLDWNSNIKWQIRTGAHHDMALAKNGDTYALARQSDIRFLYGLPVLVLDDSILVISPNGGIKDRYSLIGIMRTHISIGRVLKIYRWMLARPLYFVTFIQNLSLNGYLETSASDLLHTNSIDIVDRDIPGLCRKGDLILSFGRIDLIAILDQEKKIPRWWWGKGQVEGQHDPSLLENNHMLLFDNGTRRKSSRAIEIDPITGQLVWEYKNDPPEAFFTLTRGTCQRLPNGDTLITNSDNGYSIEVTAEGEVVWQFYNPEVRMDGTRASIHRLFRYFDKKLYPFLETFL